MGKGRRRHDEPNHWSDIVGMPDAEDKQNLKNLINNFAKEKFSFTREDDTEFVMTGAQWITAEVNDAKRSHDQDRNNPINPYGIKSEESEMRIGTAIPNVLWARISEAYPTMFKDKKHFQWFQQNFKMFNVANKQ